MLLACVMGDSTAMTIEFLRARLLSERNVSKAAKERADQLAKRVGDNSVFIFSIVFLTWSLSGIRLCFLLRSWS